MIARMLITYIHVHKHSFCLTSVLFHAHCGLSQVLPKKQWLQNLSPLDYYRFIWILFDDNWMAPWKNRISSTAMNLRKSLVKPVMWQNILTCLVPPPEIVMHDAYNVILWTSADICVVMHDDLGWKNQTTRYNFTSFLPRHWLYEWFSSVENVRRYQHVL